MNFKEANQKIEQIAQKHKNFPNPTNKGISNMRVFLDSDSFDVKVDYDVYLPTKGFNLQRPLVWDMERKKEFILAIFLKKNIPNIIISENRNRQDKNSVWYWYVLDGKQRLNTIKEFYNGEFEVEGLSCKEKSMKQAFASLADRICFDVYSYFYEDYNQEQIDNFYINIFNFTNFASVPQESEHKARLLKALEK